MTDFVHKVELTDTGFACPDCGLVIPPDIAALDATAVEMGGANVHWLPSFAYEGKARPCSKKTMQGEAIVVCIDCEGKGCDNCNHNGMLASNGAQLEATAAKPQAGETVEKAPAKLEFEKQVSRMGFQNFLQMREVTKLDES